MCAPLQERKLREEKRGEREMKGKKEKKEKTGKSFSGRIIMVWMLSVALPFLLVGMAILWQVFRTNHRDLDREIDAVLENLSGNMLEYKDFRKQ